MDIRSAGADIGRRFAIAAAFLYVAVPAAGADFDYRATVGGGYSDNVRATQTDAESEYIATAGLNFSLDQNTRRVNADVVGNLAYHDYLSNTYDPELVGSIYADTAFALVPDRLVWALGDQYGQVEVDPFQPATPDNRENINYLSTGPDFIVHVGAQTDLRLGARYSLITYEEDPLDATVVGGQASLSHSFSRHSSISMNATVRQTEFDDPVLNSNFDQLESFIRYDVQGARTNLAVDAGYTRLDRDANAAGESGALLRLDVSRRMSSSTMISLSGGHEFQTSAGAFAADLGGHGGVATAAGRQTADPFTLNRATLSWSFNRNVTSLSATANWSERAYEFNPALDQTTMVLSTRIKRDLTPKTSLQLGLSRTSFKYEQTGAEYKELTAGLGFSLSLSRQLSLNVVYDYADRSGDATLNQFTENHFWLTLGYGRGNPRDARRSPTFGVDAQGTAGN